MSASGGGEIETFLREGMRRYGEAKIAVDTFEKEVQERLLTQLEEKDDWVNFKKRRGERGRGKAVAQGASNSSIGQVIFGYQNSVDDDGGWVDLGLWWGSPRARDGAILYCSRWDAGYRLRNIQLSDPKGPVECKVLDQGKSRLLVLVGDDFQLETMARLLLDEMDRALGTQSVG